LTLLLATFACREPPGQAEEAFVFPKLETPTIDDIDLMCDPDKGQWNLEVRATSWTGGGRLYLTVDGQYIENHRVRSIAVKEDGSADELSLSLNIVSDWRDVTVGTSTIFRCSAKVSGLFVLRDQKDNPVDCRIFGANASIWGNTAGTPTCEIGDTGLY
jgi:hypothetical protein